MTNFEILGLWQDGASSAALPATLTISGNDVGLNTTSIGTYYCTLEDLAISAKLGNTPRYITLSTLKGQFETTDHEGMKLLGQIDSKGVMAFVHRLEQHLAVVCIATLVVLLLGVSYFAWGIPAASKLIAAHLPTDILHRASEETLALLDQQYLSESKLDSETQQRLVSLIQQQSPDFPSEKLYIRDGGSLGANAFALPDGRIIFTDQIVELAGEDDAEILGVFGHELGHVHHRHALRHILQNSAIALTIALIGGDVSSLGDIVLTLPVVFTQLSFSRQFELESDQFGAKYLEQRGYDSSALASILKKLHASHIGGCETDADKNACKRGEAVYKYLSTHPYIDDRVMAIENKKDTTKIP